MNTACVWWCTSPPFILQLVSYSGGIFWWHILVTCSGGIFWWHILVAYSADLVTVAYSGETLLDELSMCRVGLPGHHSLQPTQLASFEMVAHRRNTKASSDLIYFHFLF